MEYDFYGEEAKTLVYENNPEQKREVHFAKEEKRLRYEYLKKSLESNIQVELKAMKDINFAILAPGKIANKMAKAVNGTSGVELYAVASRSLERAEAFAEKWNVEKAYGSYEEMLCDPSVDLVYVASPHSCHYEHAKLCLMHGKNVLVEKAFTVNASEAGELIRLSEERHLLLAEGMWTRYMPSRELISNLIDEGTIGDITSVTANLGYPLSGIERLEKPELAGGALLDLGVYPINFALMVLNEKIKNVQSAAVMSPVGIDWSNSITLTFENDKIAVLSSDMRAATNRMGVICGTKGYIEVHNINNCEKIDVFDTNHSLISRIAVPEQVNGYEYEVASCVKAIHEGKTECPEMPHSEILRVMKLLDEIREKW